MFGALSAFLAAILAGVGFLLKSEMEKRREIERQLSEQKFKVYTGIMNIFFSVFNSVRKKTNSDEFTESMGDQMLDHIQGLLIYGSDGVVKALSTWKRSISESTNPHLTIMLITNIMIEIRKDMGNTNTKIGFDDIWGMLITDFEQYKAQLVEQGASDSGAA